MTRTTKICVARHGETDWNSAGILQGWLNVPLNDNGRRQSLELAQSLAHLRFSRIYTSPLRRAAETAEIVADWMQLPEPIHHEGLKERNFGKAQGRPKAELVESDPELMREIVTRNPAYHFDGGESPDDFADRVLGGIRDIGAQNAGARVLVITHGWALDVVTRHVRDLPRTALLDAKCKNIHCLWIRASGASAMRETDWR
jgi:probable phosphoglycerate mutase